MKVCRRLLIGDKCNRSWIVLLEQVHQQNIYIYIERERESLCCVFVYVFVFACDPTEMKLIGGSSASGTDNGTVIFMN